MAYGVYENGLIRVTQVDGSARTGLHAADGSFNVVVDDATYKGVFHPCGAYRVNSSTGSGVYDASGAYYANHFMGVGCSVTPGGSGLYYPWLFF